MAIAIVMITTHFLLLFAFSYESKHNISMRFVLGHVRGSTPGAAAEAEAAVQAEEETFGSFIRLNMTEDYLSLNLKT